MKRTPKNLDSILCVRLPYLLLALLLFSMVDGTRQMPRVRAERERAERRTPTLQTGVPRFEPADCPFDDYEIPSDERIDCGYLIVAEERGQAGSNTLQLAVAIIRTHSPEPARDPILYLEGGPGYGALNDVDYFVADAPGLRAERDIILLDQRGTGYSVPDLRCVEFNQLYSSLQMQNLTVEEQVPLEVQAAERCRDRLLGEGVNLAAYNTAASAADVNDLRTALGYSVLNLYGFSYGSHLALTVMRVYPDGVRSAVLDSAQPLQAGWWEEQAANVARGYAKLFAGCANDSACQAAYPELENHFYALVDHLNATPLIVEAPDAATGEPAPQIITGDDIVNGGFQALYETKLIAYLPLAIEEIYAGNTDVIAGLAGDLTGDASVSLSGMWFSVQCQDEAPFNDIDKVVASVEAYPRLRNLVLGDPTLTICESWGVEPAPEVETQAVYSDIPALVLAGEYDPIHPPRWSQLAASTLSQSFYYELPGTSHGVGFDGCGQELVVSFFHNPIVAPDAPCVAQLGGPPFITDLYLNRGVYRLANGLLLNFDLVKAIPLLLCLLLFVSVLLVWPIVTLATWRQRMAASPLVRWLGGLAFFATFLNVAFFTGLLLFIINTGMQQEYLLLFGLPSNAAPLFVIPWVSALLGIILLLLSMLAWTKRRGAMVGRVYYTLVAVALLGFVWVLSAWGLVGFLPA